MHRRVAIGRKLLECCVGIAANYSGAELALEEIVPASPLQTPPPNVQKGILRKWRTDRILQALTDSSSMY
jgi:hypothetical protein